MWELLMDNETNAIVVGRYDSHTKAKNALHWKIRESLDDSLGLHYSIRKVE